MRTSASAIVHTILFVCFVGPGPVIGIMPWRIAGWRLHAVNVPLQTVGAILILLGAVPLAASIVRFITEGRGTLAPYAETSHLIVTGFYRYARDPMYIGVVSMILGQALLLWNRSVLTYGLCAWLAFHLFVLLFEEPRLTAKYGDEYRAYCSRVPRWIPGSPA